MIAISSHKTAYQLLESGLSLKDTQKALNTIKQPSKGYYNITDVLRYIKDNT